MSAFDKLDLAARRAAFAHMSERKKSRTTRERMSAAKEHVAKPSESTHKPLVPPKPKRMSEKRYRELYDSEPHYVEGPGFRYRVAGLVSAQAVVNTYQRKGVETTVRPVRASAATKIARAKGH